MVVRGSGRGELDLGRGLGDAVQGEGSGTSTAAFYHVDVINTAGIVSALLEPAEADVAVGRNARTREVHRDGITGGGGNTRNGGHYYVGVVKIGEVGYITHSQFTLGGTLHGAPEVEAQCVQWLVEGG